ncbi:MAG: transketolase [Clostridia bacterium]|nr:transketolase [Clostridia bacterium]
MDSYENTVHRAFRGQPADTSDPRVLAWLIRRNGIEMAHLSRGSHIGSVLSVAEIIAVLYTRVLNVDPKDPKKPDRDRMILSKGHAGSAVYSALAETGFFPVEELKNHYGNGSLLSGHVSHKGVPGVEVSTGALGHGLGIGTGMALGAKMDGASWRTYVVLGDGECDEGAVWEAALQAAQYRLDNLTAVVDYNHMQSLDFVKNTLALEPFEDKWRDFGWFTQSVDGHDTEALTAAFARAKENTGSGKPSVILANTVKGRGVSFMENNILWHYRTPQGDEYEAAVRELEEKRP